MKICTKCKQKKKREEFSKKKSSKDGLYSYCRDCGNLISNNYKLLNKEKVTLSRKLHYNKQYHIKYNEINKEKIKKQHAEYYIKFKDIINKRNNLYNKTPKGKFIQNIKYDRRRNQLLNGKHTFEQWIELKKKYKYRCAICNKKRKLTRDHIIPLSKNGSNNIENIQPLCQSCNSRKHNKITRNEKDKYI